ncbi:MAG: hypothetical protein IKR73_00765 [Oscillospiraceae bacterium]|nr:hypothetical protein [Oscillospiraceae bacterium]
MDNKNYKTAKILVLIPLIIFAVMAVSALLYEVAGDPTTNLGMALIGIFAVGALLLPLPCLIMAVMGTVYASRAKAEGAAQAGKFYVIGVIEIIVIIAAVIGFGIYFLAGLWNVAMGV